MKKLCFILILIISLYSFGQKTPKIIQGTVFIDSIPVEDVHILNKTKEIGTTSSNKGFFQIIANEGDVLLISHLNYEIQEFNITKQNVKSELINLFLEKKTYLLDEVVINDRKGIFDIDSDIKTNFSPEINAKTLKLPYAKSMADKEKTIKIRSGLTVNINGVYNSLSGKNKQKKLLQKLTKEQEVLNKIRTFYTDGFFIKQLHISKEQINYFLDFCYSKGILQLYSQEKYLELTTVFVERSKYFNYNQNKDSTRITKK